MNEMEQLKQRIAALESQLANTVKAEDEKEEEDAEKTAKATLASEIMALERQLGADDEEDAEDKKASSKKAEMCEECGKNPCECEEKKADDKEDEIKDKKASEVDPNGVEEQITQDKFSEVEKITHGQELTTGPSMGAVAPTRSEYVARMKAASVRLDKVAEYLEKHGRRELAFRIDKIADAIDEKINEEDK